MNGREKKGPKKVGSSAGRSKGRDHSSAVKPAVTVTKAAAASDSEDDALSVRSGASLSSTVAFQGSSRPASRYASDDEDEGDYLADSEFKDALEALAEKRATLREGALRTLHRLMCDNFLGELVQSSQETLLEACMKCLRKGKSAEQVLALNTLAVCFVQFDDQLRESLYHSVRTPLQTLIRDDTVPATGARALGFICFMSSHDADDRHTNMELFQAFIRPAAPSADLTDAAVTMWALLLATQPPNRAVAAFDTASGMLKKMLEHGDVDVRVSAAEAIAVLVEGCRQANEDFDMTCGEVMDDIISDLSALTKDADKKKTKKDRSKQRSEVRSILHYIEGTSRDMSESIKIGHETVEVEGWREGAQFDSIRAVLGSGLQQHLMTNMGIRSIFGLGAPPVEALLQPRERHAHHKHLLMQQYAPREKLRVQTRHTQRAAKHENYEGDYD